MVPVSPVIPGHEGEERVFGADQPEYQPLPALVVGSDSLLTRWHLTWRERLRILWTGDLYLWLMPFGRPLQPVLPTVDRPACSPLPEGVPVESLG